MSDLDAVARTAFARAHALWEADQDDPDEGWDVPEPDEDRVDRVVDDDLEPP